MSRTFEITIQRKSEDRWPVVVQQVPGAESAGAAARASSCWTRTSCPGRASPQEYGRCWAGPSSAMRCATPSMQARREGDDAAPRAAVVEDGELRPLRWERLWRPARRRLGIRWRSTSAPVLPLPAQRHRPPLPADRPPRPAGLDRRRQPDRPGANTRWPRSMSAAAVARRPGGARRRSPPTSWPRSRARSARRRWMRCASDSPPSATRCCTSSATAGSRRDDRRAAAVTWPKPDGEVDPVPADAA